nr:hypothetical protein [Gemmatimonadaceae bacterium]
AQKHGTPVVAIMYFNNNAFTKEARELDGLSKGVPDFLITEMSRNPNIRVVERDQIQKLVDEGKLTTAGLVDRETAVRVGKLLGAGHMIFGGFMADPKGNFRIDARAVDVETGEIEYTERVQDKSDNIMTLIGQLAEKLNTGMKLPAPARRTGSAEPAMAPSTPPAAATAVASNAQKAFGAATTTTKLPMRYAVMYGKALDMQDRKEYGRAAELFSAVLKDFPEFGPAQQHSKRVQ